MEKHISSQFDTELNAISNRVVEMGGWVETQIVNTMKCLTSFDMELVNKVLETEDKINQMELAIDKDITALIARRQPTAGDLRLLLGIAKVTANLERSGDESAKIARIARTIQSSELARAMPIAELRYMTELCVEMLRLTLNALARLDAEQALLIIRDDQKIDIEFNGFLRKLITFMMEDVRTISPSLNLLFVAKALERIGDHSKNIAKIIIYIVSGTDVRHAPIEFAETAVK